MEGGPGGVGSGRGVFGVYDTPVFSQGTSLCKAGTSGSKFHHPSFFFWTLKSLLNTIPFLGVGTVEVPSLHFIAKFHHVERCLYQQKNHFDKHMTIS